MMWIGSHLAGLLVLVATVYGSGVLLRRACHLDLGEAYRPLTHLCLGLAAWTSLAFLLASTQLLARGPLLICLGVGVLGGGILVWRRRGAWRRRGLEKVPTTDPEAKRRPRSHDLFVAFLALLVLAPMALLALVPTVSWDASAYHLTVPRLFLDHGGFRAIPLNVYSNWPMGTEMLFALAMLIQDFVLAKLVHFAFGVGVLYGMYVAVRDDPSAGDVENMGSEDEGSRNLDIPERRLAGLLAAAAFLSCGVVAYEMRVAYVDLAHAFYLLAGFIFLRQWRLDPARRAPLMLAGLCCGLMAGTKLNGFVGVLALAGLLVPTLIATWRQRGGKALWGHLAAFTVPFAALWTPWLIKSAVVTGNPIYPVGYEFFGGKGWSAALATQLQTWQQGIGMGREPLDFLLLPWRVVTQGGAGYDRFDGEIGLLWLFLVPLALRQARRSAAVRQPLLVASIFFLLWAMTSQQLRLLIPALPFAAMAGARAVVEVLPSLSTKRWLHSLLLAGALLLLLSDSVPLWVQASKATLRMASTPASQLVASGEPPIFASVNALPKSARLLLLNTNQGFYCRREYLADSFFEASQINDWLQPQASPSEMRQALDDEEITHVLLDRQPRPVTYPPALLAMLQDAKWVQLQVQSPDQRFLLFALRR